MKHTTDSLVETVRNIFQDSDHVSWQSDAEMITKTVLTLQLLINKMQQHQLTYYYTVVGRTEMSEPEVHRCYYKSCLFTTIIDDCLLRGSKE